MSTTLFFLVPIGMLAVVWSFCFVGACFPTGGLPRPPYSNTILNEPSLIAYWPLSDFLNSQLPAGAPALPPPPQGSTSVGIALDLTGKNHNGSYINPPVYPSGTTFLTTMGNPPVDLNPTLNLHQASIVAGDAFARQQESASLRRFRRRLRQHSVGGEFASVDRLHTRSLDQAQMDRNGIYLVCVWRTYQQRHRLCALYQCPKPMGVHHRRRHSTYQCQHNGAGCCQ